MATQSAQPVRKPAPRATSRQTPGRPTPGRSTAGRTSSRDAGRARSKQTENRALRPFQMPFERTNIMIILAGIGVIILGYCLMYFSPTMSAVALTVSPIVLLLGYCVIVPYGIMAGIRKKRATAGATAAAMGAVAPEIVPTVTNGSSL